MILFRNGTMGTSFATIKPKLQALMVEMCAQHPRLKGSACGEFWSYGAKLEADGDTIVGGKLCHTAYEVYHKVTPRDPDDWETLRHCTDYMLRIDPPDATYQTYCGSNYCGVLCAPPPASETTSTTSTASTSTTTEAPATATPVGINDVEISETWLSVMIAAGIAGTVVMCVVIFVGALWSWKLRHWAYGNLSDEKGGVFSGEDSDEDNEIAIENGGGGNDGGGVELNAF